MIYKCKVCNKEPKVCNKELKRRTEIPGLWTQELDTGLWTLDSERWAVDVGLWTLNARL